MSSITHNQAAHSITRSKGPATKKFRCLKGRNKVAEGNALGLSTAPWLQAEDLPRPIATLVAPVLWQPYRLQKTSAHLTQGVVPPASELALGYVVSGFQPGGGPTEQSRTLLLANWCAINRALGLFHETERFRADNGYTCAAI